MQIGAWIHGEESPSLAQQIALAAENGLQTIRCYHYGYAATAASTLKKHGLSLLAGMHIDGEALVAGWRSQVRLDELEAYQVLGVPLEAICVGNELREGGDAADKKRFTARLAFALANVLHDYRRWLDDHGFQTPLTYAMEGIVFDKQGRFYEWLWPLVDACDIVGVNFYPMTAEGWFTFGAFEESRRFLCDKRQRHDRLVAFEHGLRTLLGQLESVHKPLILTETGFPSAVGYHMEGERLVIPEGDPERYTEAMYEFLGIIKRVDADYGHPIKALYFYEWRDNLHHDKIWNIEASPIHVAFGLCDRHGVPKTDIKALLEIMK
jgi:hypothetical protein